MPTEIPTFASELAETIADLIDEHGPLALLQAIQAEFQRRAAIFGPWRLLADDLAGVCEREQARREAK